MLFAKKVMIVERVITVFVFVGSSSHHYCCGVMTIDAGWRNQTGIMTLQLNI